MMSLPRIVCLFALAAILTGCGDQTAAGRRQLRQNIEEALAKMEAAQRSFADPNYQAGTQSDDYRQQKLTEAAGDLKKLIDANPTMADVVPALRVHASAQQALARHQADILARVEWAAASNMAASLLQQSINVADATSRVELFHTDSSTVVKKLQAQLGQKQESIKTLTGQAAAFQRTIDENQSKRTALLAQRDSGRAKADDLRTKAFASKDAKTQSELTQQAIDAELAANKAQADADGHHNALAKAQAELAIVAKQLALDQAAAKLMQDQLQEQEKRANDDLAARQKMESGDQDFSKKSVVNVLVTQFDKLKQKYDQDIAKPYDQAVAHIDQAIGSLQKAQQAAKGDQVRQVKLELLSAQVTKAQILADRTMARKDLEQSLTLVVNRLQKQVADTVVRPMADLAKAMSQANQQDAQAAATLIDEAGKLSNDLSTGGTGDQIAAVAVKHYSLLENSTQRINAAASDDNLPKINMGPAPVAPKAPEAAPTPAPAPPADTGTEATPAPAPQDPPADAEPMK
ncbi:MAG: hypothetical protein WD042_10275 [Phycisphaeraceae bacterium]